ncbi:MAG: hypothetical protein AB3N20_18340 [Rhizobiaceae bacterium]
MKLPARTVAAMVLLSFVGWNTPVQSAGTENWGVITRTQSANLGTIRRSHSLNWGILPRASKDDEEPAEKSDQQDKLSE